ncbi:MAG: hypothetical protein Unbinned1322contig1000_64 [Prokaryotic dsDNA virus sp.]|nr:hypothetical protein [Aequorivita sp.]QDP57320.1 MAG: hypothetical protein Unbinned1322contig1000_64 [Prokaryotic dsDNA virus sp.]|tara:strand:+ start:2741 stop:3250 length:510 start_codon:yes stop_codon:yes gene_type:complete
MASKNIFKQLSQELFDSTRGLFGDKESSERSTTGKNTNKFLDDPAIQGGLKGGQQGAAAGASAGSLAGPGIGTAVGAAIGGVIGLFVGIKQGDKVKKEDDRLQASESNNERERAKAETGARAQRLALISRSPSRDERTGDGASALAPISGGDPFVGSPSSKSSKTSGTF